MHPVYEGHISLLWLTRNVVSCCTLQGLLITVHAIFMILLPRYDMLGLMLTNGNHIKRHLVLDSHSVAICHLAFAL